MSTLTPAELSHLPETTDTSYLDAATQRRKIYGPETGLERSESRSNKTCMDCGSEKGGRGLLCRACYSKRRDASIMMRCEMCGAEHQRKRYDLRKSLKKGQRDFYCSNRCMRAHAPLKTLRPCRMCGEQCTKGRKFCSRPCARLGTYGEPTMMPCGMCDMEFHPANSTQRFCSTACANESHSALMMGERNPNYKDGQFPYSALFAGLRPMILERDNRQCRCCNQAEEPITFEWCGKAVERTNLCVHHLDEDTQNNRPENLIVMCSTCHIIHHKSAVTPFPELSDAASTATRSMTSKWQRQVTSLLEKYSSTTV